MAIVNTNVISFCVISAERDTSVHGYIVDGVFDGVIVTPHEEYHVELAGKFFDQLVDFHSVIYATSDVDFGAINGSTPVCGGTGTAYKKLKKLQSTAKPVVQQNNKFRTKKALSPTNRFCPILIAADELFFQNIGGGSETTTMNEITSLVTSVNTIFSGTDFDLDGDIDAIGFLIRRLSILRSSMPGYRYGSTTIGVTDFLDIWSQEDHDTFCLAMLLTYRDFDNGVLGLAWVAEPPGGNRGGICETRLTLSVGPRNLNSAIVTFLNFGNTQPRPVTVITMAHEFGHNFGSPVSHMCVPVLYCVLIDSHVTIGNVQCTEDVQVTLYYQFYGHIYQQSSVIVMIRDGTTITSKRVILSLLCAHNILACTV